jgi:hypothetical protein
MWFVNLVNLVRYESVCGSLGGSIRFVMEFKICVHSKRWVID